MRRLDYNIYHEMLVFGKAGKLHGRVRSGFLRLALASCAGGVAAIAAVRNVRCQLERPASAAALRHDRDVYGIASDRDLAEYNSCSSVYHEDAVAATIRDIQAICRSIQSHSGESSPEVNFLDDAVVDGVDDGYCAVHALFLMPPIKRHVSTMRFGSITRIAAAAAARPGHSGDDRVGDGSTTASSGQVLFVTKALCTPTSTLMSHGLEQPTGNVLSDVLDAIS